ncbi:hypothetical protein NIES593_07415 [Hydrococcus rivularis NIES-593]|uniref:Uncharacterized protein n=1 Tax=Hydrococcus rivularis NIES-593 TaxID=1921803 RepID=A0A1U7HLU6_9CYAN|nr:hypothetical protein [Hydrococcus rivularis]OKH24495.1 hypothetical protein NIES593_07415 [Hydrococcus rivularis NIES-593]
MLLMQSFQALGSKLFTSKIAPILSLGLATIMAIPTLALSLEEKQLEREPSSDRISEMYFAEATSKKSPLADGIYLYGQSPEPEQIGQEYLVFRVQQGKVIGAIYLPRSEFNCFSGTVDSHRMHLSIVDPYNNAVYPYEIALQDLSPVASGDRLPRAVGLEGYHQISTISENDRRILDVCLQKYQ